MIIEYCQAVLKIWRKFEENVKNGRKAETVSKDYKAINKWKQTSKVYRWRLRGDLTAQNGAGHFCAAAEAYGSVRLRSISFSVNSPSSCKDVPPVSGVFGIGTVLLILFTGTLVGRFVKLELPKQKWECRQAEA